MIKDMKENSRPKLSGLLPSLIPCILLYKKCNTIFHAAYVSLVFYVLIKLMLIKQTVTIHSKLFPTSDILIYDAV